MDIIGLICEYNPFHNGHIYHIKKIKEMYPNSLLILVLNGNFLERGEVSILTKEEKVKIALEYDIDLVIELPTIYGTQSADIFAEKAITILNYLQVEKIVFGSEANNIEALCEIVLEINKESYQIKVKENLKKGLNYPTALAHAINSKIDFNNPNDLLAISYIKAIKKNNFNITPISIKRTSSYHDTKSNDKIISASNIRNKLLNKENITDYLPESVSKKIVKTKEDIMFKLIKNKILTTPNLEEFLDVDEGIHNRLLKVINKSNNMNELITNIKTKRYTYNKINRMLIHILLGITKKDNNNAKLDYLHILGFNKKGQDYLKKIKKDINIPLKVNKDSIIYKYELIAASIFDLINDTKTINFELKNKPIYKSSK
jgi:predicted nucleotidyltransferase